MRRAEDQSPARLADDTPAEEGNHPARFGDYELFRQIGRGRMGVVYEARQISLNRIVALKIILGGDLASLSSPAVRRFQVEAEAAAKLDHPNIVAIHELGEREGLPFFSMERIDGAGLDREMATLALPSFDRTSGKRSIDKTAAGHTQVRIARLVVSLARALHYAHEQGVIHGDVKSSNILIDKCGEPHLTGFGIAHLHAQEGELTRSGVIGSPSHMSPGQASGRRGELTAATDIYGLGAILYELLTGQPPFRAVTPSETLLQVMEENPSAPHGSNPLVNRDLSIICLKCLEKNARYRYTSAAELADDLERWIRAHRASLPERLVRWCQRKPAIATLLCSLAQRPV
jgi:serine/threonine-protein kinase